MTEEHKADVIRLLDKALTVAELREVLSYSPDNAKVLFCCDYGDHCHTEQSIPVTQVENLEWYERINKSAYSQSGLCVDRLKESKEEEPDEVEEWEHTKEGVDTVVLIR